MIRLLYISTARHPFTQPELDAVLRVSRRNNAAVDVTGLLIAGGRRFLQALEGPADAVQTTFERIAQDPRHYAIVELVREGVDTRQFPNWSMGAQAGGIAPGTGSIDAAIAALIAPITDPSLRGYFTGFAQRQAAA